MATVCAEQVRHTDPTAKVCDHAAKLVPGVRVTTKCPLACTNKHEVPVGQKGCVWAVPDEHGMVTVKIDNKDCLKVLLMAEPEDLDIASDALLPPGTEVQVMGIKLETGKATVMVSAGERGTILGGSIDTSMAKYRVEMAARRIITCVGAHMVQPVMKSGVLGKIKQITKKLSRGVSLQAESTASLTKSPPTEGIGNLRKTPEYSSITGSPKSRSRQVMASTYGCVTFGSFGSAAESLECGLTDTASSSATPGDKALPPPPAKGPSQRRRAPADAALGERQESEGESSDGD